MGLIQSIDITEKLQEIDLKLNSYVSEQMAFQERYLNIIIDGMNIIYGNCHSISSEEHQKHENQLNALNQLLKSLNKEVMKYYKSENRMSCEMNSILGITSIMLLIFVLFFIIFMYKPRSDVRALRDQNKCIIESLHSIEDQLDDEYDEEVDESDDEEDDNKEDDKEKDDIQDNDESDSLSVATIDFESDFDSDAIYLGFDTCWVSDEQDLDPNH